MAVDIAELKYPVGCFVNWNKRNYKILKNTNDYMGEAMDFMGNVIPFQFHCAGIESERVTCPRRVAELYVQFRKLDCC